PDLLRPGMWPPPTGGRPLSRTDLAFYTTLGSYHYEKGELDLAKKELETAAERRWPDPFTYLNLARVYAAQGRYDNASSELKRALYCCAGNVRLQKMVFKEQLAIAEKTGDNAGAEQIRKAIEEIEGGRIRQD
ncbi:MAG: tetratricopeptide repeat protein, partial [Chloroflexi bacterium]|nr:tetratricopeptide repeat protein [Chloroflexota bacterium]